MDRSFLERAERGRASREAIDALGEAIAEMAAHVDAATHRLLAQIRAFDEAGGWYDQGEIHAGVPSGTGGSPAKGKATRDIPTVGDTLISAETARRLACDAGVVEVATDERGTPQDVGRKTRRISPALRRALRLRDGGCAFPGCSNHRFVDAHHIVHWADGGETKKENLVLLCRPHHTLLHERGFRIEPREQGFAFYEPEGRPVPYVGKRKTVCPGALLKAHTDRGLHIDPGTNMPMWSGKPPDYSACIDALASRARRERTRRSV